MIPDRQSDIIELINDKLDYMAKVLSHNSSHNRSNRMYEIDGAIVRLFPYFLFTCVICWVIILAYTDTYTVTNVINMLCLIFVYAFALLGLGCSTHLNRGPFPMWFIFVLSILLSLIIWCLTRLVGDFIYIEVVYNTLINMGVSIYGIYEVILSLLIITIVMFLTTIGVLSVIVAYLRKYVVDILIMMDGHAKIKRRGKAEKFFMVPNVIDVISIELNPIEEPHTFNLRSSFNLKAYMIIFGMAISSYFFVNPYFLNVMNSSTMLSIMIMLSMFIPALVIPWQIIMDVGAHIKSEAHRDYYLWRGAKYRLFSAFIALGAFAMMLFLSIHLGNSILHIIKNYTFYFISLTIIAEMYSAIYSNNFVNGLKISIYKEYYAKRNKIPLN